MNFITKTCLLKDISEIFINYGTSNRYYDVILHQVYKSVSLEMVAVSHSNATINDIPSTLPLHGDSRDLPGDLILYLVMSTV